MDDAEGVGEGAGMLEVEGEGEEFCGEVHGVGGVEVGWEARISLVVAMESTRCWWRVSSQGFSAMVRGAQLSSSYWSLRPAPREKAGRVGYAGPTFILVVGCCPEDKGQGEYDGGEDDGCHPGQAVFE